LSVDEGNLQEQEDIFAWHGEGLICAASLTSRIGADCDFYDNIQQRLDSLQLHFGLFEPSELTSVRV
jgi:hypothetical protein